MKAKDVLIARGLFTQELEEKITRFQKYIYPNQAAQVEDVICATLLYRYEAAKLDRVSRKDLPAFIRHSKHTYIMVMFETPRPDDSEFD